MKLKIVINIDTSKIVNKAVFCVYIRGIFKWRILETKEHTYTSYNEAEDAIISYFKQYGNCKIHIDGNVYTRH
jgi:hypothetical protein